MERQKEFIIYGLGEKGKIYYNFFKEKGLDGYVKGFCDQRYLELGEYDGRKCYGYDEVKSLGIPFLISVYDQHTFSEIAEQIKKDGNRSFEMNDIADYLGEDRVVFNRDFVAFYHIDNMDDYFAEAEADASINCFWGEQTAFFQMFCQLDISSVIELACGRGRHVRKYIDKASDVTLVDILDKNLDICRERFCQYDKVHYYCNNGFNLEQLPSGTYTALFSYDAVVHFEMMDIYEYLKDIYRVLADGGRALIHHSNYDGDYKASFIDSPHGRSYMNAGIFAYLAFRCGFKILAQEVVTWGGVADLDCVSLLEK
ncbi:MAG: class I SAM-dependent methyltransferase [Lachnospiraceae bacterium]|nr:class I SAM-dependent methyltransferase [Lachnospiraceae bacterium]